MPDFPADIRDLVGRMLQVRPDKRITIQEIKQHEAFKRDLPANYKCPSPLPPPVAVDPVESSDLEQDVLDVFHQLGYEQDAEIFADLGSPDPNMAKVFYLMLSNRMSFDHLQWNFDPDDAADAPVMITGGPIREPIADHYSASMTSSSVIERTYYADEAPDFDSDYSQEIDIEGTLEPTMAELQQFLKSRGFAWFHPTEWRLLARRAEPDQMDLICDAFLADGALRMRIRSPLGDPHEVETLVEDFQSGSH